MMTRRGGGPAGTTGAAGAASVGVSGVAAAASTGARILAAGAGETGADTTAGAVVTGETTSTEGVIGAAGLGAAGVVAAGAAATTGRSGAGCDGGDGAVATTGGRAITGPIGGLLAIAGAGAGTTIFACWRGSGTMRRGPGGPACTTGVAGEAGGGTGATTLEGGETKEGETEVGGAATTTAGRTGGADRMAASACLRSRIALTASPGLETFERSNLGLFSTVGLFELTERPPALK
jgi:hypothetical protein